METRWHLLNMEALQHLRPLSFGDRSKQQARDTALQRPLPVTVKY